MNARPRAANDRGLEVSPSFYRVCKRWPSLFGRCTLLSTDHSRAGDVANALSEACRYRRPSDAPILWSDLVPLLARQFAREEADGYHGIIRHAAPALRSDVERLTAEHQALLAELERLVSFTRQWAREEFFWAVNRFAALLDAHEQREARLMRNFLLVPAFDA